MKRHKKSPDYHGSFKTFFGIQVPSFSEHYSPAFEVAAYHWVSNLEIGSLQHQVQVQVQDQTPLRHLTHQRECKAGNTQQPCPRLILRSRNKSLGPILYPGYDARGFRALLEYEHQALDEDGKRAFPRTIYVELERRLRDEERRGVDDTDSDTDMYSDWPPPSASPSNTNHPTSQNPKTALLTALFALHSLAFHLSMPTLQNDTILQIISASHKYHILPTWDMLEPWDSYHLESESLILW
ncbi:hypothetical protein DL95DRAFT_461158 [Leptodontidium sp. 2 PMI_412]|nr:hypothetical protein DL95DRAFT_461158 [Leptodontidium sp. 2 PMI_412]